MTASSWLQAATREERSLLPDTQARPGDVLIPHWTGGRDTALDMTVINPLQTGFVVQAAALLLNRLPSFASPDVDGVE